MLNQEHKTRNIPEENILQNFDMDNFEASCSNQKNQAPQEIIVIKQLEVEVYINLYIYLIDILAIFTFLKKRTDAKI